MIDFAAIEGFDWDDGNFRKSLYKHGVAQEEAEQVLMGAPLIAADAAYSQSEDRFQALGETLDGRALHVTFTVRDNGRKIRIISARPMNRKERAIYEQET